MRKKPRSISVAVIEIPDDTGPIYCLLESSDGYTDGVSGVLLRGREERARDWIEEILGTWRPNYIMTDNPTGANGQTFRSYVAGAGALNGTQWISSSYTPEENGSAQEKYKVMAEQARRVISLIGAEE